MLLMSLSSNFWITLINLVVHHFAVLLRTKSSVRTLSNFLTKWRIEMKHILERLLLNGTNVHVTISPNSRRWWTMNILWKMTIWCGFCQTCTKDSSGLWLEILLFLLLCVAVVFGLCLILCFIISTLPKSLVNEPQQKHQNETDSIQWIRTSFMHCTEYSAHAVQIYITSYTQFWI